MLSNRHTTVFPRRRFVNIIHILQTKFTICRQLLQIRSTRCKIDLSVADFTALSAEFIHTVDKNEENHYVFSGNHYFAFLPLRLRDRERGDNDRRSTHPRLWRMADCQRGGLRKRRRAGENLLLRRYRNGRNPGSRSYRWYC